MCLAFPRFPVTENRVARRDCSTLDWCSPPFRFPDRGSNRRCLQAANGALVRSLARSRAHRRVNGCTRVARSTARWKTSARATRCGMALLHTRASRILCDRVSRALPSNIIGPISIASFFQPPSTPSSSVDQKTRPDNDRPVFPGGSTLHSYDSLRYSTLFAFAFTLHNLQTKFYIDS